jgi:hypothetical protein
VMKLLKRAVPTRWFLVLDNLLLPSGSFVLILLLNE